MALKHETFSGFMCLKLQCSAHDTEIHPSWVKPKARLAQYPTSSNGQD